MESPIFLVGPSDDLFTTEVSDLTCVLRQSMKESFLSSSFVDIRKNTQTNKQNGPKILFRYIKNLTVNMLFDFIKVKWNVFIIRFRKGENILKVLFYFEVLLIMLLFSCLILLMWERLFDNKKFGRIRSI